MRSSVFGISILFFVVADLKRICETENGSLEIKNDKVRQMLGKNGLATQCIQAKNAISCKDMTLVQLCLKINAKMGGVNNAIATNNITRLVSLPSELSFCWAFINEEGIWHITMKGDKSLFICLSIHEGPQSTGN